MKINEMINTFKGTPAHNHSTEWEKWSLDFFHQKNYIFDPHLDMTLKIDIDKSREVYEESYKTPNSSFTSYILFKTLKSIKKQKCLSFRKLEDEKWYYFENLPLFFPVANGKNTRFTEIIIFNASQMSWKEFSEKYSDEVNKAKTLDAKEFETDNSLWSISHFIGNLPSLLFTSFSIHRPSTPSGRPFFYYGKRHIYQDRLHIPLSITFDHSNIDPVIISQLVEDLNLELIKN